MNSERLEEWVVLNENFQGEINLKIKNKYTGIVHPATLNFTGRTCEIEGNNGHYSLHVGLVPDPLTKSMWDMVIHENNEGEEYQ